MKIFDFVKKDKKTLELEEYKAPQSAIAEKKQMQGSSITIDPINSKKPDVYYDKTAAIFGYAKIAVTVLLIALIILAFTVFSDIFTAENFKYLIKNININTSGEIEDFRTVIFSDEEGISFAEFKQDFVIASPGVLKLYDYNGGLSLKSTPSTQNPGLCTSDEYILLYDMGDKDYYIYNNFSQLYSSECEGNIITGDMSDKGVFVIMTESARYAAHIYVYNEDFELIREIKKANYVTSVKLSSDGEYLLITSVKLTGAQSVSTVSVYEIESNSIVIEENIHSEIPVSAEFDRDGAELGLTVITDNSLRRYTLRGEEGMISFVDQEVLGYDMGEEYTAYVVKNGVIDNSASVVVVSNKGMEKVYSVDFKEKIVDIEICGNDVYILTKTNIIKIDKDATKTILELERSPKGLVVFDKGDVFVIYSSTAELVHWE